MADEAPLTNTEAARTETGEIKDQTTTQETTQTTETEKPKPEQTEKPDDLLAKPEEKKDEEKKDEPKPEVPEKYEFKVPEGFELNEKFSGEAQATFKELGLTQAQADKIVEIYTKHALEGADAPYRKFEEITTGWRNEVLNNPKLGDGNDLKPEVKAILGRAIDGMGAKEATAFREAMTLTGAANHPAVIEGLLALGRQATEGRPVKGGNPSPEGQSRPGAPASAAKALFPNLP